MPHCEKQDCKNTRLGPHDVVEDIGTGELICEDCAEDVEVVAVSATKAKPETFLGRPYDYEFSYSKKHGFRAGVQLGKARLTLEIDQEELDNTFGPAD